MKNRQLKWTAVLLVGLVVTSATGQDKLPTRDLLDLEATAELERQQQFLDIQQLRNRVGSVADHLEGILPDQPAELGDQVLRSLIEKVDYQERQQREEDLRRQDRRQEDRPRADRPRETRQPGDRERDNRQQDRRPQLLQEPIAPARMEPRPDSPQRRPQYDQQPFRGRPDARPSASDRRPDRDPRQAERREMLRHAARQLEQMAAEMEQQELYEQADRLREQANEFWHQARER